MLTKLLITVMTAILLVVVCFPVQAHNGHISVLIDPPSSDEQPWGGDSQNSGDDLPLLSAPDPGIYPGTFFFIKLTFDYGWFTISEYVLDTFSGNTTKTVTAPAVPIDATSTETQNGDTGAGIK
jgi:hypothetical protein